jgi:hypothetical protein
MASPLIEQEPLGRLGAPRPRSAAWNLLLMLALLFFAAAACKDQNAIEKARRDGAAAGKRDGAGAGDADGYNSAYEPAKDDAYDAKIKELYASDNFNRKRSYTLLVLGFAFLSGFGFQYGILYLLRKREYLLDIDRIVLPRHETRVNMTRLLDDEGLDELPALKPHADPTPDSTNDE